MLSRPLNASSARKGAIASTAPRPAPGRGAAPPGRTSLRRGRPTHRQVPGGATGAPPETHDAQGPTSGASRSGYGSSPTWPRHWLRPSTSRPSLGPRGRRARGRGGTGRRRPDPPRVRRRRGERRPAGRVLGPQALRAELCVVGLGRRTRRASRRMPMRRASSPEACPTRKCGASARSGARRRGRDCTFLRG